MKEVYSNAKNCLEFVQKLNKELEGKFVYYGPNDIGRYYFKDKSSKQNNDYLYKEGLEVRLDFHDGKSLRIGIGSYNDSLGKKLAVLSDFYRVLNDLFGEPTMYYTIKDYEKEVVSLRWSITNKEEDIKEFKTGNGPADTKVDELIVIGENRSKPTTGYQLKDTTKNLIARQIGVPFELINLVDENIEDYVKYKNGKELSCPNDVLIDGVPVTSYERKLIKKEEN